jgi:hypothetical protein
MQKLRSFWSRLSGPTKVGLTFACIAVLLTVIGQLRNAEQVTARSLLLGMLIGGGSWGLVSWAIAYAAWDVEKELAEEEETEQALSARAESEREE